MAAPKRTMDVAGAMVKNDASTAELLAAIRHIWESARLQAVRSVNSALVQANWLIGRQIVEAEQQGKSRAAYSSRLLETLSKSLEKDYGSGFSVSALQYMRAFYLGYPALLDIQHVAGVGSEKQHAVRVESAQGSPDAKGHALRDLSASATEAEWQPGRLHAGLSWTHYRTLLKVERREARDFYEIEAIRNGWSARQLERPQPHRPRHWQALPRPEEERQRIARRSGEERTALLSCGGARHCRDGAAHELSLALRHTSR